MSHTIPRKGGSTVVGWEEVKEMVGGEDESTRLVIGWLELEGKARSNYSPSLPHHLTLVKFSPIGGRKAECVSEADVARHSLSLTCSTLRSTLQHLESEKQQALQDARDNLAKGFRHTAKRCLRKKKELEKSIEKKGIALDNTEALLARINEAESDAKVLEAFKVGGAALKQRLAEAGLSQDNVFSTITNLQDVMEEGEEIATALSEGIETGGPTEDELEDELALLLSTDTPPIQFDLPQVPEDPIPQPTHQKTKQMEPAL